MGSSPRLLRLVPPLLAFAVWVNLARYHAGQTGDDAFILFRYARNLARDGTLSWNPGETPVEGFSSPLWTLVLAAGEALGWRAPELARVLGIGLGGLAVIGVYALARRLGAGEGGAAGAAVLAASLRPLHFWAGSGLETAAYGCAFVWAAAGLVGGARLGLALPLAALGVLRPEGPGVVVVALVLDALRRRRLDGTLVGAALLPALGWLAFRLWTYGVPMPNPYYAKATGPLGDRLREGLAYGRDALVALVPLGLAAAWGRSSAAGVAVLLVAAELAAVVLGGGDWMVYGRLLVPVLLALAALGLGLAAAPGGWGPRMLAALGAALLVSWLPAPPVWQRVLTGQTLPPEGWQEGTLVPASAEVAAWVRAHYPPTVRVAVNHAGALPWYLDTPALDMTGLCDAHIARGVQGGLHEKFDAAYVLSQAPDLIVFNTRVEPGTGGVWAHGGYWEGEDALLRDADFQAHYQPLPVAWERVARGGTKAWILIYARDTGSNEGNSAG